MYCPDCSNKARERNANIEAIRLEAKQKSNEQKEPMAICEEISMGELFTVSATKAIEQRFAIREIIYELQ